MVDGRPVLARLEEVHRIQIGYVDTPRVRRRTFGPVLLHVHAEEAHVYAVDLFKREQSFGPVRERFAHFPLEPGGREGNC